MSNTNHAVEIRGLTFRYGERAALDDLALQVGPGEIFGLLGPNGSGKTTLFRILCTLVPPQEGTAHVLGKNVSNNSREIRRQIGITFQSPSLDGKLTVWENLRHQAHLYGFRGREMRLRIDELLQQFQLADRRNDVVDELSGGLKRRVELAKGLLHRPELLLLDEPSSGLDPAARHDLWNHFIQLREHGISILLTTHLMEEAERCDRVGIVDSGRLVASGTPDELRTKLGGEGVTIRARDPDALAATISSRFQLTPQRVGGALRLELEGNAELPGELMREYASEILSMVFGKPTLDDVFLAKTGHRFEEDAS